MLVNKCYFGFDVGSSGVLFVESWRLWPAIDIETVGKNFTQNPKNKKTKLTNSL